MTFILNKKKFPNILLNGGGDLCDPTLDGQLLNEYNCPTVPIPFGITTLFLKQKRLFLKIEHVLQELGLQNLETMEQGEAPPLKKAFEAWFEMVKNKYKKHIYKLSIDKHPKFIKNS